MWRLIMVYSVFLTGFSNKNRIKTCILYRNKKKFILKTYISNDKYKSQFGLRHSLPQVQTNHVDLHILWLARSTLLIKHFTKACHVGGFTMPYTLHVYLPASLSIFSSEILNRPFSHYYLPCRLLFNGCMSICMWQSYFGRVGEDVLVREF